jgi:DNA-binding response OmpR family regulator
VVEEAERIKPDIVLLDIGLPGIDGFEVCRRLRERFGRTMRIIAITGYGQRSDRRRATEIGFDEYLVKPVTMDNIRAALQRD